MERAARDFHRKVNAVAFFTRGRMPPTLTPTRRFGYRRASATV